MTLEEMIAQIKVLLDEPNTEHPSKRQIMINLTSNLQQYHNELQLTKAPWNIHTWLLSVTPGVTEYPVTAQDFGKPLLVLAKEASAPEQEVRIVNIENFDQPYPSLAIAFYGKTVLSHGYYCRLSPDPSQAAQYTVWYKVGAIPFLPLTAELVMPEHHHLIIHRTAMACLPYCRWYEFDRSEWPGKAIGLQQALGNSLFGYEDSFGRWKNNQKQEQMRARSLWGDG